MARRDQAAFGIIDDTTALGLDTVEQFETYEEYLDSQVTDADMFFLEDEDLARQLVELGYRGSGDTLQREEFEQRKKALRARSTQKKQCAKTTFFRRKRSIGFSFLACTCNTRRTGEEWQTNVNYLHTRSEQQRTRSQWVHRLCI